MRHKNYFISLFLFLAALTASAQTCPGPPNRTALINLQKSNIVNGTRAYQFVMTDTCGNQRYVTLDSVLVLIIDSLSADSLLRNWYNSNDTTTDPYRLATIDSVAEWSGDNAEGAILMKMGALAGGRLLIDTAAALWHNGLGGTNAVQADPQGIDITTSLTATRAVNITTDTVNTLGAVDPTNFRLNFLSDNSYLFADSLKVVGLGQFPGFPSYSTDGTTKGLFYSPIQSGEVSLLNGDGENGYFSRARLYSNYTELEVLESSGQSYIGHGENGNGFETIINAISNQSDQLGSHLALLSYPNGGADIFITYFDPNPDEDILGAALYFGAQTSSVPIELQNRAFGVCNIFEEQPYKWININIPNDSLGNQISFYNSSYLWVNDRPTGTAGDTIVHYWAEDGVNAGKNPGFMTINEIRAGAPNLYNTSDITTDNTRIADVLQTLTFRSDQGDLDGIFPFRFELTDAGAANEPEMMVWKFPTDSLTLSKSDQEIILNSPGTHFILSSGDYMIVSGDSVQIGDMEEVQSGDILSVMPNDGNNPRTIRSLEGVFNADVLSWSAGAAGDRWDAVPANRSAIVVTDGTGTTTPALSVQDILVDGAGGGDIELNYTPAMPSASYTTVRYIYNEGGDGAVDVTTDQDWQFRDTTGDLGASFSLAAGSNAKLIWIYNATPANARFFVVLF